MVKCRVRRDADADAVAVAVADTRLSKDVPW